MAMKSRKWATKSPWCLMRTTPSLKYIHKGRRPPTALSPTSWVYVGKPKKEIKLSMPQGEQVFPLERLEVKTGGIEEGALVTTGPNDAGTVNEKCDWTHWSIHSRE